MSLKAALSFLEQVDADPALRARAAERTGELDLSGLVRLGGEAGVTFSQQDLRAAWRKRRILRAATARAMAGRAAD